MGKEGDIEDWYSVYQDVVLAGERLIERKGYTNWAIGLTASFIANAILRNERKIIPVSTIVKGLYTIEDEVFLSVPAVVGSDGVDEVVSMRLTDDELRNLRHSAEVLSRIQKDLDVPAGVQCC